MLVATASAAALLLFIAALAVPRLVAATLQRRDHERESTTLSNGSGAGALFVMRSPR